MAVAACVRASNSERMRFVGFRAKMSHARRPSSFVHLGAYAQLKCNHFLCGYWNIFGLSEFRLQASRAARYMLSPKAIFLPIPPPPHLIPRLPSPPRSAPRCKHACGSSTTGRTSRGSSPRKPLSPPRGVSCRTSSGRVRPPPRPTSGPWRPPRPEVFSGGPRLGAHGRGGGGGSGRAVERT